MSLKERMKMFESAGNSGPDAAGRPASASGGGSCWLNPLVLDSFNPKAPLLSKPLSECPLPSPFFRQLLRGEFVPVKRSWGAARGPSAADLMKKIQANDPSITTVDLSNSASIQCKPEEYASQLSAAMKGNTHVKELKLENCGLGDKEGEYLGEMLAENSCLVTLDLQKNRINNAGGSAIAKGLAKNKTLVTLDLMSQGKTRWGDHTLELFIEAFQYNITLLKINWRLESRKSFALNKMLTRNNEIDRRKKSGMSCEDILPPALKGTVPITSPKSGPMPAVTQPPRDQFDKENSPPSSRPVSETRTESDGSSVPAPVQQPVTTATETAQAPTSGPQVPAQPTSGSETRAKWEQRVTQNGSAQSSAPPPGVPKVRKGGTVLGRWPPAGLQEA